MKSLGVFLLAAFFIFPLSHSLAVPRQQDGVEFSVQFLTSPKHLDASHKKFKGVKDFHEEVIDGIYKYTTVRVKSFSEATELLTKMRETGFKDAFIVRYKDGQRAMTNNASATKIAKTENKDAVVKEEPVKPEPVREKNPAETKSQKEKPVTGATMTQTEPEFKGGQDSLNAFMTKNLHYPELRMQKVEETGVLVSFTVDTNGKIKNIKVVGSLNKKLDTEALRIVRSMPDWNPGTIGGSAANMEVLLPVNFYRPK